MEIKAKIEDLIYQPTLCKTLPKFNFSELDEAISRSTFLLEFPNDSRVAISRWVSPKRTRSYPYARVYDTLDIKPRITIIPVVKDEGVDGDRDYLQFDTVSMMSLLQVYVILGYYDNAIRSSRSPSKLKISAQEFDNEYIRKKILESMNYHSDALHWNLKQLQDIKNFGEKAISSYAKISTKTGIPMHRTQNAVNRFEEIGRSLEAFKNTSRKNAENAAHREILTEHQNESTIGEKPSITITNYLGGKYFLTVDEIHLDEEKRKIVLIEAKNTTDPTKPFTSLNDIKDAIFKMIIFTNLTDIMINGEQYKHESAIKLTSPGIFRYRNLDVKHKELYDQLIHESETNNFSVIHE